MTPVLQDLLGIERPIFQGGMAWVSGWRLASAVSEAGALGTLGAGTLKPEMLQSHIEKTLRATQAPFAVNIPVVNVRLTDGIDPAERSVQIVEQSAVPIVVISAGSPRRFTQRLKDAGKKVIHVVPSARLAQKAEDAGVDAVVVECSDAAGHVAGDGPPLEELLRTTLSQVSIPVVAAGGMATAEDVARAMGWGAHGVQLGTRFVATHECSAHENYKEALVQAGAEDTVIYCRAYHPGRGLRTPVVQKLLELEAQGQSVEELLAYRGRGRAKAGCADGDLEKGILPCGRGVGAISAIQSVREVVFDLARGLPN
jgi:enoyl-[acyl-carrier protein] reductase II